VRRRGRGRASEDQQEESGDGERHGEHGEIAVTVVRMAMSEPPTEVAGQYLAAAEGGGGEGELGLVARGRRWSVEGPVGR